MQQGPTQWSDLRLDSFDLQCDLRYTGSISEQDRAATGALSALCAGEPVDVAYETA